MTEYRSVLERAGSNAPQPDLQVERVLRRRDRKHRNQRIRAGVLGLAIAIAVGWLGVNAIRSTPPVPADPPEEPSVDLGIFEPVAGRILYENRDGIWGVDPAAPAEQAPVQLTSDPATPLGWSSDGTELLVMRDMRNAGEGMDLVVLHADGSKTLVAEQNGWIPGATISPDGSRVVFPDKGALYVADAEGGPAEVLLDGEDAMYAPTFSPDGAKIAYVMGSGDHSHRVWVMDADGNNAHQILANETTLGAGHVYGLAWSPAGDRIALGIDTSGTYTFAPDGSGFTRVTKTGVHPYWSPNGSQIAFSLVWPYTDRAGFGPLAIADADGSNVREFDLAASGPWHPGAPVEEPSPTPTPTPVVLPGLGALAYGVNGDVFLADADGADAIKIADGVPVDGADECASGEVRAEYVVFGTAWSPDGRYLAYWDWGCPVPEGAWGTVRIIDTAGNLVASFPGEGWTISWSPDSTRVAVWDSWGEGDTTIGVYGLDGVRQAALTVPSPPAGDYSPVWSRDGTSLLLPGVQVPLDGDAPTPLPDHLNFFGVYSPDGSRVAYIDHGSLVVEDADGSDSQKAGGPLEFWDLAWSPNGDLVAFEADGTELLVRDVATGAVTSLLDVTRSERLSVMEFSTDGDRILFTRSDADGGRSSLWSIGADGSDLRRLVDGIDWADRQPQGRSS